MLEKIQSYIDAHEAEMLGDAKTLIAINSEKMEAKPGMPFGEGTVQALQAAEEILTRCGFATKNYENYVLTADMGTGPACLDILAHLDVVPAGEGWTVTEPFVPVVKDGMLYGRGSSDDKGPAIAALYAMRAVKELGIPLTGNCRLILGTDEECGSGDIRYYYEREKQAPMTFSPDADFPLIHIEKGGLHLQLTARAEAETESEPRLLQIQAGTKINVVPGKAKASVAGLSLGTVASAAEKVNEATGVAFELSEQEEEIHILSIGTSAHAASPQAGNNALTALLALLSELPFASQAVRGCLKNLCVLFPHGDYHGKALGVNHEDAESGKLTLSLNLFSYDGKEFSGAFDCRAPLCANDANTADVIRGKLTAAGFAASDNRMYAPHYVPADSPFVQTLLSCYEEVTGRKEKPLAIGGGTYVHHIENGVAFGCADIHMDNHMHGADEFMSVEQMKKSAVIFALAIARLCR